MKKFFIKKNTQRGIATMPIVLALGILIVVVALSVTALSSAETFTTHGAYQSEKALLYAETGVRDALVRMARNKNYSCTTTDCYSIDIEPNGCATLRACAKVSVSSGSGQGVGTVNGGGLVGYWALDEGNGISTADFSGQGNAATLVNMAMPPSSTSGWTLGKYGYALNFDGVDDYVALGSGINALFENILDQEGTVTAWFNSNSWGANKYEAVISIGADDNNYVMIRRVYYLGFLFTNDSGGTSRTITKPIAQVPTGVWTFVALTWSKSANETKAYFNGAQEGATLPGPGTKNWNFGSKTNTLGSAYFNTGSTPDPVGLFNGTIDDTRVYNRALSAAELSALYAAGPPDPKIITAKGISGSNVRTLSVSAVYDPSQYGQIQSAVWKEVGN